MAFAVHDALFGLLVDQAPDAMIFADLDGIIQVWNRAATAMFGHTSDSAIGQDLNLVIPEDLRDAHWRGYQQALEAGRTKYRGRALPTRAMKATGEMFYIESSFEIIHDARGAVVGALAHARDISERFEHDRASRRRVRELEHELAALRAAGSSDAIGHGSA
jgi:PAS domain S-box-containing protein